MNTFKSVALSLIAAGAIAAPLAIATPSMANDQSVLTQGSHRVDRQQIAGRLTARFSPADRTDAAASAPRQCENVEAHYAAANKANPGLVPGDASSWEQWASDQRQAIASGPVCS
ncbi:hypothetical protein VQ044_09275 [Aurantimonas sp. C2-5-R2]|uniref:hypothetical protein n=1 Tax=Aurantimonas sp. E1-2-R+4 TaxID=3113714 RepID=UPI002F940866